MMNDKTEVQANDGSMMENSIKFRISNKSKEPKTPKKHILKWAFLWLIFKPKHHKK